MNFESVFIYLFVFILSIFFAKLSEIQLCTLEKVKQENKTRKNNIIQISVVMFFMLSVLPPCLLAAFRDISVGADIIGYVLPNFNFGVTSNTNFSTFYSNMPVPTELAFAYLIYFSAKYFNIQFLFFLIEVLIIVPTFLAALNFKSEISLSSSVAIFLFLFYNFSLSGMRQSIAMAFLLLALSNYYKKANAKMIILSCVAFLFHSSVIIIVAITFFIYYIEKSKHRKQLYICFAIALIALFFSYRNIALFASEIVSLINPRYGYYIIRYLNNEIKWEDIILSELIFKSIIVFISLFSFIIVYKNKKTSIPIVPIIVMCLLGRYFTVFNANFYESTRIAYYFDYLLILLVPMVKQKCYKKNFITQVGINSLIIVPVFLYWIYFIMYVGSYRTNNYVLGF